MTSIPSICGDWAVRMRQLETDFDREHLEVITQFCRGGNLPFNAPLLKRARNPHRTIATRLYANAVYSGGVPSGNHPGLEIPRASLTTGGHAQMRIETSAMLERDQVLLVFSDLSVLYIETSGASTRDHVRVLPTPLVMRPSQVYAGDRHRISTRLSKSGTVRQLRIGHAVAVLDDWVAGQDHLYAPPPSELTRAWAHQVDIEAAALARRLAARKARPAVLPQSRSTSPHLYVPRIGRLPLPPLEHPRAALIARRDAHPDDIHLGHIAFDPDDPLIDDLGQVLEISLEVLQVSTSDPEMREATISAALLPSSPWSDRALLSISSSLPGREEEIRREMLKIAGPDLMPVASRFFGFANATWDLSVPDVVVRLARANSRPAPSNHQLLASHARLVQLKERLSRREGDVSRKSA